MSGRYRQVHSYEALRLWVRAEIYNKNGASIATREILTDELQERWDRAVV